VALANVKEAMAVWIEAAQSEGQPVPPPKGQSLIFA
jgi:predicted RNase H-like HicB family nuclease